MKLAEFDAIIQAFIDDGMDETSLKSRINAFLQKKPVIKPTQLLEQAQGLLNANNISPSHFKQISAVIADINVQRALDNHATDKTQVLAPPENDIEPNLEAAYKTEVLADISDSVIDGIGAAEEGSEDSSLPEIGSVLKGRFELHEKIGKGGMGVVYKARDLIKVQAKDSNPYVAIKVLSEKFKKHSRAFIALQREASKTQRLAHPNITTVYDFDHDGEIIYMTMELLSGQPFDKLIKQLPPSGLPSTVALRYIKDLCNALQYAHQQNFIHCDLKPANIFLCDNGLVKLLDFGITRAIKKEQQKDSEETLFDPASLKALTPAYASLEMFRGDPPDPRDDIYALACVAYELLTGKHPYKKVAAHKALELNLKPVAVKSLSRRQNKAFSDALALRREDRTESVEQFLEDIKKPKSRLKEFLLTSFVVLAIGAASLIKPIQNHMLEEAQLRTIQAIKSGDSLELIKLLESIQQKDESTQAYLTSVLRKEIIMYYQNNINAAVNAAEKQYDFPKAYQLLEEVQLLYPDSASLVEANKQLAMKKERLITTLLKNFDELQANKKDTGRLLEILKEAEPNHPLVTTLNNAN